MKEEDRGETGIKSPDVIIIAPKSSTEIIALSTGTISPKKFKVIPSSQIFNADLWIDVSAELDEQKPSNFSTSRVTAEQTLYNMALKKIALYALQKETLKRSVTINFIEPETIDELMEGEGFETLQEYIQYLGFESEFSKSLGDMHLKAIIKGDENYDIVWQNPDNVPKN